MRHHRISLTIIGALALLLASAAIAHAAEEPADCVNPNIGGIGRLLTSTAPSVYLPHSPMSVAPQAAWSIDRYLSGRILGFPAGAGTLVPTSGPLETDAAKTVSTYDHDLETALPYYYSVLLEKFDIEAEYTVGEHTVFFRFAYPENKAAHLIWRGRSGMNVVSPTVIDSGGPAPAAGGAVAASGTPGGARAGAGGGARGGGGGGGGGRGGRGGGFFVAEFSKPFKIEDAGQAGGATALTFEPAKGERIGVRIATSSISLEQARKNLAKEMPDWNFDAAKGRARDTWNRALGQIQVKGGTKEQRTVFYTALYRSLRRMVNITEDGQYRGFDGQMHAAGDHPFYTDDWLWDTHRSMHPLQMILDPHQQEDMIQSYVRMYEQSGWMPRFPSYGGSGSAMIGHHTASVIADAYFKGYRNFDVEKAYVGINKNLMQATLLPFRGGAATPLDKVYHEKGFFPALGIGEVETVSQVHPFERRQAVSVTLETCYDDWCAAQLAKALGKQADYEYFLKRAHNYENVYDARIGFMAPKTADGKWIEPFDPLWASGPGGRDYFTEGNSWVYTWEVRHDVAGLIRLMGGRDQFISNLDSVFFQQFGPNVAKHHFLYNYPDMTCLMGQYAQGNENDYHMLYLYCYAGQPWKTQRKVRESMALWYTAGPEGMPGDEDGGAMSAWYVLSAMGFYQVTPGFPAYVIGSPIFEETRITPVGGKPFTITAKDVSAKNKYIQSAELNGKPLNKPWFSHADLVAGGTLVFQMGPRPNMSWGAAPDAAPPSMSDK